MKRILTLFTALLLVPPATLHASERKLLDKTIAGIETSAASPTLVDL